MNWYTNSFVIKLRNIGRVLGLNKFIAAALYGREYEVKYDNDFSKKIQKGDCIWDVGANIGYYTKLFCSRIGAEGVVFAFEPSPTNYSRLISECSSLSNVKFFQFGLGREEGQLSFQQGGDDLGATSRIIDNEPGGKFVHIRSGDDIIAEGIADIPSAIKIDVEGFEWEVLEGMSELLKNVQVKVLGIEVHFSILQERGMGEVPIKIENFLKKNGFSINWSDSSHLIAER